MPDSKNLGEIFPELLRQGIIDATKLAQGAKSCRLSSACFGCRPAFCQVCLYRYRLEEVVSTEADTVEQIETELVEQGKLPTSRLLEATGQQAYYRHMGGIVIVEELAEPLQPSSLAVVQRQQRHSQPAGQVDHAVGGTVEDEKGDGIE